MFSAPTGKSSASSKRGHINNYSQSNGEPYPSQYRLEQQQQQEQHVVHKKPRIQDHRGLNRRQEKEVGDNSDHNPGSVYVIHPEDMNRKVIDCRVNVPEFIDDYRCLGVAMLLNSKHYAIYRKIDLGNENYYCLSLQKRECMRHPPEGLEMGSFPATILAHQVNIPRQYMKWLWAHIKDFSEENMPVLNKSYFLGHIDFRVVHEWNEPYQIAGRTHKPNFRTINIVKNVLQRGSKDMEPSDVERRFGLSIKQAKENFGMKLDKIKLNINGILSLKNALERVIPENLRPSDKERDEMQLEIEEQVQREAMDGLEDISPPGTP